MKLQEESKSQAPSSKHKRDTKLQASSINALNTDESAATQKIRFDQESSDQGASRVIPSDPAAERSPRMIQRSVRDDQICVLTFDRPGSAANIFDRGTLLELGEELDFIAGAPQLRGVIITSAKRS